MRAEAVASSRPSVRSWGITSAPRRCITRYALVNPQRIARAAGETPRPGSSQNKGTRVGSTLTQGSGDGRAAGRFLFAQGHAIYVTGHIAHLPGPLERVIAVPAPRREILKDECVEATSQIDFVGTLQLYNLRFMGALHELSEALPPLLKMRRAGPTIASGDRTAHRRISAATARGRSCAPWTWCRRRRDPFAGVQPAASVRPWKRT